MFEGEGNSRCECGNCELDSVSGDQREGLQLVHSRGNQFKFQRVGKRNTIENTLISREFQTAWCMTSPTHVAESILFGVRVHVIDIHRGFLLRALEAL